MWIAIIVVIAIVLLLSVREEVTIVRVDGRSSAEREAEEREDALFKARAKANGFWPWEVEP